MGASARLLTRATHPFCRLKVSDISPVPSGEFRSTTPTASLGMTLFTSAEVSELKERNSTANCSLTVSGVARCCHEATSERGRGWVGYLPQTTMPEVKRASTRSHSWQFLDGTPYTNYRTSAPIFVVGCTARARRPFNALRRQISVYFCTRLMVQQYVRGTSA